jgi:drug/metabolite transporter (DMT)-like permease
MRVERAHGVEKARARKDAADIAGSQAGLHEPVSRGAADSSRTDITPAAASSNMKGYIFAILTFTIFACQDAISKHLGAIYPPVFIAMLRFWVFAVFTIVVAAHFGGGLRKVMRSRAPWLQVLRGVLLAAQVVVAITSFSMAGLVQTQAIMSATPLITAVLAIPVLGETVGWKRWSAIICGLIGVLIILSPGANLLSTDLMIPVASATLLALYAVATRLSSRYDPPMTSFAAIGIIGAAALSLVGPFFWVEMDASGWFWLSLVCITGVTSHYCFIRAYEYLNAASVQPVSYLQLVLASMIGVGIFGEELTQHLVIGSTIVVAAGLFIIWRETITLRMRQQKRRP